MSRDAARNAALITNDLSKAAWLSSVENSSESHVERGNVVPDINLPYENYDKNLSDNFQFILSTNRYRPQTRLFQLHLKSHAFNKPRFHIRI